jgi:tetratricopeptide (TPR) repeat protein
VAALGDLYAIAGRVDDAEDRWALVERIAELGRANGGVYDRQLVLFLADHDRDQERAVALATAEIELRADVYGHDALAWALFKAGRLDEADAAVARALSLGTPDGRVHFHAGLIAEALGRVDDAREHLATVSERRAALPPGQWGVLDAALERLDQ